MAQGFHQLWEKQYMKLKITKWSGGSLWLPDLLPTSMEEYGCSPAENMAFILNIYMFESDNIF